MKWFYSHISLLVAILIATSPIFGRNKPQPVDIELILREYIQIRCSENSDELYKQWKKGKSEAELATIPIVLGNGLLDQISDSVLTDSTYYSACMSCISIMEKSVNTILESGQINGLYFKDIDSICLPVRYIMANAYDKVLKYNTADSLYILTAKEIGRDFGTESEEFVFWTNQCAESMQRKYKNYSGAIQLLLPAKEAAIHSKEVSDSTACMFLISLAQKYQRTGNHKEAMNLAHEAEKKVNGNRQLIYQVNGILGELYWNEGNTEKGAECFKKVETNATSLCDFFSSGINFANILKRTGYYNEAENILLSLGNYISSEELTANSLFHYNEALGGLYTFSNPEKSKEYFRKAEKYLNYISYPELIRHILNSEVYPNFDNGFKIISALDRAEMLYGKFVENDPRLLYELISLKGYYLMDVSDYAKAREYLETAYLNMLDYSECDIQLLGVLDNLAKLDEIEGNNIRREYYLILQLRGAKVYGENLELYLHAVSNLLNFYIQTKNIDASQYYFDIYRKYDTNSLSTQCYKYKLMLLKGEIKEAEKTLESIKKSFPEDAEIVNKLIYQFYISIKSPKVTEVATDVCTDFKNNLLRKLLFMSNRERRNIESELLTRRNELITSIRFAPDITKLALDYSLFSKGLLFHTQNEIRKSVVDSASVRTELAKIKNLKAELTRAINSLDQKSANSLQNAIDSRERYFIDDYVDKTKIIGIFNHYTFDYLLNSLSTSDIMIDFVEYSDSDRKCIGCFIIDKSTPVKFIELGEVSTLKSDKIYTQIWTNLIPYISNKKNIYFSTDGILNTLPIEFAEDQNNIPMCEKFNTHRVFHLADIHSDASIGQRIEIIGVADYNSPKGQSYDIDDEYRGNWNNLAGVETELYRIAETLDGVCKYNRVFNDGATEQYVKSLSGSNITTLHISTHGFYIGKENLTKALDEPKDFNHSIAKRTLMGNRTSVSGLIMRNGNISWKAENNDNEDDDILTSEEVETLTFPNLNLTVLSACETGLGELSADGVWGLQRAFRIAGSAAIICSLRQVNDIGAADFMAEFYHQSVIGYNIHDSFYNTRKKLISQDPYKKDVWSAFILIE